MALTSFERQLVDNWADTARRDAAHVNRVWAAMTARELELLKAAAVAGFKTGHQHDIRFRPYPKDSWVVAGVVQFRGDLWGWPKLTRRQRRLYWEAAVMGFAQGTRWYGCTTGLPADEDLPFIVTDACLHSARFPAINHVTDHKSSRRWRATS